MLVFSPAVISPGPPVGIEPDKISTDLIWDLHSVLVDQNSTTYDVKRAKQQMLKRLEELSGSPLAKMIVPPIASPAKAVQAPGQQSVLTDDAPVCQPCKVHAESAFGRGRMPTAARPRRNLMTRRTATNPNFLFRPRRNLFAPSFSREFTGDADPSRRSSERSQVSSRCLARWENEGGSFLNHETSNASNS